MKRLLFYLKLLRDLPRIESRISRLEADMAAVGRGQLEAGNRLLVKDKTVSDCHRATLHALSDPTYISPQTGDLWVVGQDYERSWP
jgi:hypothetical protein